ncbi:MAG: hypothetical protein A3F11_08800 [Gammaproteobacteria bacterium RIFCSPHIGHO2_12_FULL_37_14]|nr:MAG: hypothetical protein A3F11_08800 [Gammaproteobacteria bacterium RIFCSPHIGHO2_12_FULL_37_14]
MKEDEQPSNLLEEEQQLQIDEISLKKEQIKLRKSEIYTEINKKKEQIKLCKEEKNLQIFERELELLELREKTRRLKDMLHIRNNLQQSLQQENEGYKNKTSLLEVENNLLKSGNSILRDCVQQSFTVHENLLAEFYVAINHSLSLQADDAAKIILINQSLENHLQSISILESEIQKQQEEVTWLEKAKEEQELNLTEKNAKLSYQIAEEQQERQIAEKKARQFLEEKTNQLEEKIAEIRKIFNQTQEGETFERLSELLQAKIGEEQEQSQAIQLKILDLENKEEKLEGKFAPLFSKYQVETEKEATQKKILKNQKTRIFYNQFYQIFSAKINAAVLLTSDLIKHNDRIADKVTEFSAALVENVIGSAVPIPIVGAVFATFASTLVKGVGGGIKGNIQNKKAKNTADSVIALDLATELSSLVATRLTEQYREMLLDTNDDKNIKHAAETCAKLLYDFVKSGKLLNYKDETVAEKVTILLKEVQDKKMIEEGLHPSKGRLMDKMTNFFHKKNKGQETDEEEGANCDSEAANDLPSYEMILKKAQLDHSHSPPTIVNNVHKHYTNGGSTDTVREARGKAEFALKHSAITQETTSRLLKNQAAQISSQQEKISFLENENTLQKEKLNALEKQVTHLMDLIQNLTTLLNEKMPTYVTLPTGIAENYRMLQKTTSLSELPVNPSTLFSTTTSPAKKSEKPYRRGFLNSKMLWKTSHSTGSLNINNAM